MHVLIVDDNPTVLEIMRIIFESSDFRISEARSGNTAYEIFRNEKPTLVVTDTNMPDGTGIDLLRRIRASCALTKVIVLFSHLEGDPDMTSREVYALGADLVMSKPFWSEEIINHSLKLLHLI